MILSMLLVTAILPVCAYEDKEDIRIENYLKEERFSDIKDDKWYADYAMRAYDRGIMVGNTTIFDKVQTFLPDALLTREMAVQILYRMNYDKLRTDTREDIDYTLPLLYSDTITGSWYIPAVRWATEADITVGIGDNMFGVGKPITREELTTLIDRYLAYKDLKLAEKKSGLSHFNDEETISDWAAESLELLCLGGIIEGDDKGNFRPQDNITRAEAATIFVRLDDAIIYDISHLLDFEDNDATTIVLRDSDGPLKKEIEKNDPAEVKAILGELRKINFSYSRTQAQSSDGSGRSLCIIDKNGKTLFGMSFSPDTFKLPEGRIYVFDDAYLQDYCDMLDQADPK